MRYIGNKTKLLGFIARVLRERGITCGTAVDPFTGTASVARALRGWGFRVIASDIMEYGRLYAHAAVQAMEQPRVDVSTPRRRLGSIRDAIAWLMRVPGEPGFLHENFTLEGVEGQRLGRMYFLPDNAARIDAARTTIEAWRRHGAIDDDAFAILTASLIDGADRVANTAGVYAAWVKQWQPNARRTLRLQAIAPGSGPAGVALRADAIPLVESLGRVDLLYIDPPYNTRQYTAYYHIPEIIALGWFDDAPRLRGKTGLLYDEDRRSAWSKLSGCEGALEELLARTRARHIVMSYNAEGIIPAPAIERIFRAHGRAGTYRRYVQRYRRYRSDTDGDGRRYKGDRVEEYLYCVEKG